MGTSLLKGMLQSNGRDKYYSQDHPNKCNIAILINTKREKFLVEWDTKRQLEFPFPVMVYEFGANKTLTICMKAWELSRQRDLRGQDIVMKTINWGDPKFYSFPPWSFH